MSSIIKVNTVQDQDGNNIINENANTITIGASGDTISIPAGATLANSGTATGFASIAWQSSIVTAATLTAESGKGYWIDTSSNACTITLPGSASVGDQIIFTDYARNWATNAVTINQNSLKFQGNTSPNPVYDTNGESVDIVYSGTTKGWIPNNDGAVAFETQQTYTANFLVIAGGGGGGYDRGGGGGAGGYRNSFNSEASGGGGSAETALALIPGGTVYTVTVGNGGAGSSSASAKGTPGVDSSISGTGITTITSAGGGGGGTGQPSYREGLAGGSGGGAGYNSPASPSGGAGTSGQGYAGANYPSGTTAGGGGGAGQLGNGDSGGNGVASTITGSSVTRGGGAGGHNGGASAPPGGSGGGGNGGQDGSSAAQNGTANTGGGGGGGAGSGVSTTGGTGGKGVVILRVATSDYSGTTSGSPTVTTSGSDTIMVFNASGSYTS
mgnify:CR=1 FL=1|tara:strand:+ start:91 stop:1416 length:1326 start_codon:yes stop_codon:yes gene_type:complete